MQKARRQKLSATFKEFFASERSGAIVLIICTIFSLIAANSLFSTGYLGFWKIYLGPLSIEHWIGEALMTIFFLLIGLELERELYVGELANLRGALLPIVAAIGGASLPAAIHFALNAGTASQAGIGIPMATDIAFAIGVLALLGRRVSASLKVFLVALAVMDDLIAIIVIALFYSENLSFTYVLLAFGVLALLLVFNRLRVMSLIPYLIGGVVVWYFMLKSGVHATIAGVLTAFVIPFSSREAGSTAPSERLEHFLQKPVAFLILPLFALANTGIVVAAGAAAELVSTNSLGIFLGLVAGKPIGILLASFLAVSFGLCHLPSDLAWRHIFGAGMLGGIGFTMSIFITNLAFAGSGDEINSSKMAILLASLVAGVGGFIWLWLSDVRQAAADSDTIELIDDGS